MPRIEPAVRPAALVLVLFGALAATRGAQAQAPALNLPQPSPAARVEQTVGVTRISVDYHRPRVREREVWGGLVPYDQVWRAGANENTVIAVSTPVKVEGRELAAGSYGLHMIPTPGRWTVAFSKMDAAWGSFTYDAAEDALRVEVEPVAAPHEEALAYTFDDPTATAVTLSLRWGELRVPVRIEVDTPEAVYRSLKLELRGLAQFFWQPWNQAAAYLVGNKIHLDEAMEWVDRSISIQKNFTNVYTKSRILTERGETAAAKALIDESLPSASEAEVNTYGYQLLGAGNATDAVDIFRENLRRHPESWNTYDSLGEGLVALGQKAEAIRSYEKALSMAPDGQKARIEQILAGLRK